jgi:hypothetical protein
VKTPLTKCVSWYLIVAMFLIGIAPKVDAGLSPSELIAMLPTDRNADLEKVRQVLEMKMVNERLKQLGLTKAEIQARLNSISDQQLHQIALQLDDLRVGGDGGAGLAIVVLLIVILFLMIMMLTSYRGSRGYFRR